MAIQYKMYQEKRKGSKYKDQWYGKAVVNDVISTEQLAELVQRNCSVKRSDVVAVLMELSEVMRDQLLAGNRVRIDGIGSFKVGFRSCPAQTLDDWKVSTNIIGTHINFQPETVTSTSGGKRTRTAKALQGIEFRELRKYNTPDKEEPQP